MSYSARCLHSVCSGLNGKEDVEVPHLSWTSPSYSGVTPPARARSMLGGLMEKLKESRGGGKNVKDGQKRRNGE